MYATFVDEIPVKEGETRDEEDDGADQEEQEEEEEMWIQKMTAVQNGFFEAGLRIRIHFIRIRIQHFRLNTDPDPWL